MGIQSGMSYPDSIQENEPNYLYPKMDIFKHPMTKRQDYDLKQKNWHTLSNYWINFPTKK